jgi:hypothetical protein
MPLAPPVTTATAPLKSSMAIVLSGLFRYHCS